MKRFTKTRTMAKDYKAEYAANKPIQAIQTRYKGHYFRSRIEARWAVFYDSLSIEWMYEPEGYVVRGVPYLPDFYIPHLDCFIEIKGAEPTDEEKDKARWLCEVTKKSVYIFFGAMDSSHGDSAIEYMIWTGDDGKQFPVEDTGKAWAKCPKCGDSGITHCGDPGRLPCGCDGVRHEYHPRILIALEEAQSYRF